MKRGGFKIEQYAKKLDCFGAEFNFNLPEEGYKIRTCSGMVVTFCVLIIIIFYGTMQFLRLMNTEQPSVMISVRDHYFDVDDEFTSDEGLMLAFGITAFDINYESIEDASYGQIKAYYKTWGLGDDYAVKFEEIESK